MELWCKITEASFCDLVCSDPGKDVKGWGMNDRGTARDSVSAPNYYCCEFDNAGAVISVDESIMCSFQILKPAETKWNWSFAQIS
ncbi:unnamed protein product [Eruca vesicaria subsp. sativa]|uniref:Uncharacterized protein n=1 Tax=Eruca vesicaria subsp. sativa TaxID=29727 RepID=A0ABC8L6F1_ERUVS|nr:unnamed protein product [Eruca vesicaria subsp. sativa]